MTVACAISPAPDSFVSGLLGYLDCQAVTLGSQGFMTLAAPGSSVSLLLAGLLTIFVALMGYRMLFGETPDVRDGVLGFVKIGIVLAFATSWPAYRTVVFDVVLQTPADLAGEIGRPAGLPGATGGLAARMDGVDRSFRTLAIYGVGTPTREQVEQSNGVAPPLFGNFDVFALGAARVVFLVGSLGAFALVRLSAGLLLALGPLFIAFLLFTATRGIAEGWIRGLLAATLGSTAIAIALGIELALLEPWLADLVTRRASGVAIPGVPATMLATATIFAIATAGLLALISRVAFGLRLPTDKWQMSGSSSMPAGLVRNAGSVTSTPSSYMPVGARSRAVAIADSIAASQRRDEAAVSVGLSRAQTVSGSITRADRDSASVAGPPLGQSFRRRTVRRVSGGATKRDKAS
jgi:type IV secretion system protein VirB6